MHSNLGFVVHQYHACWFSDRPIRAVCVLRLRRSEISALSADGSAESRGNILPHLTTDKSEDGTKKMRKFIENLQSYLIEFLMLNFEKNGLSLTELQYNNLW